MAEPGVDAELVRREVIGSVTMSTAESCGGYLSWEQLSALPLPDGSTQRLVDPGKGGIWNPKDFRATLAIITSPDGPYPDREDGGLLQYSYQRGPEGGKNLKLRLAAELKLPIIRLNKISKGYYTPIFPTYVVGDNPITREFTLTLDEALRVIPGGAGLSPLERSYAERLVQQRVHQPRFRAQIMLAYSGTCCICRLKHPELLDAAHIIEDGDARGDAVVTNGLSMCKIHHAAYDRALLGITPGYVVQINQRLLDEIDGPMLRHGLQEMHGVSLQLPRRVQDHPDRERLAVRYEAYQRA